MPFTEKPSVFGRYPNFYIPAPTNIRHYLEYPEAEVLRSMKLPYPFRIKNSTSPRKIERLEDLDIANTSLDTTSNTNYINREEPSYLSLPTEYSKRQSLDLSQVSKRLTKERPKVLNEDQRGNTHHSRNGASKSKRALAMSNQTKQDILTWLPKQETDNQRSSSKDKSDKNIATSSTFNHDGNNDSPKLHIPKINTILERVPSNNQQL